MNLYTTQLGHFLVTHGAVEWIVISVDCVMSLYLGSPSLYAAASMNLFPQWEQLYGLSLFDNHDISSNVAGDWYGEKESGTLILHRTTQRLKAVQI